MKEGGVAMPGKTAFYVAWWSSMSATFALLAAGDVAASVPFSVFNMLCTGYALGWALHGKLRGGDGK
ncbi:hypothetical protein [Adlercreutzia sp. CNCM I-6216]